MSLKSPAPRMMPVDHLLERCWFFSPSAVNGGCRIQSAAFQRRRNPVVHGARVVTLHTEQGGPLAANLWVVR
jgi:hypothetical protein